MKKKVWILNHYAGGMLFDKGGRHYSIAKYLKRAGYEPVIFCSNARHSSEGGLFFENDNLWHEQLAEEIKVPFVFVKSRSYKGNGKTRVLNMMDYFINVQKAVKEYAVLHGKPDVIIGSSVHPLACVAALFLSKAFSCKNIVEIRDLWPESIVAYNVVSRKSPIVKVLYQLEKWIYKKADTVIFTMEGGKDYIIEKGWASANGGPVNLKKIHYINNGVDLEAFEYNREHYSIDDSDLNDSEILSIVYTGSLRKVNDIKGLLLAQKLLEEKNVSNHKVLIYGDGDKKIEWEKLIEKQSIKGIEFKGRVKKRQIPYILCNADILFVDGAEESPIIRFGMSQNKMFEYLAANKPIIAPLNDNYNIVEKYHCGCKIDNTAVRIAEALEFLLNNEEQRTEMGKAAKIASSEYDFCVLTERYISIIED